MAAPVFESTVVSARLFEKNNQRILQLTPEAEERRGPLWLSGRLAVEGLSSPIQQFRARYKGDSSRMAVSL
jgi:hypothetical protein